MLSPDCIGLRRIKITKTPRAPRGRSRHFFIEFAYIRTSSQRQKVSGKINSEAKEKQIAKDKLQDKEREDEENDPLWKKRTVKTISEDANKRPNVEKQKDGKRDKECGVKAKGAEKLKAKQGSERARAAAEGAIDTKQIVRKAEIVYAESFRNHPE